MKAMLAERRTWLGLGILVAVLVVLAGWFTMIGPVREDTASLASQETDARDRNAALTQKLVVLKGEQQGLPALRADLGSAMRGLPTSSGLPDLTRQFTGQAKTAGVGVKSVVVGAPSAVAQTAASAPAGATTTVGAKTPVAAAEAAGQLFGIPITISTTGPVTSQIAFLRALQQVGPRRALVVSTQLAAGTDAAAGTAATPAAATSIKASSTMTIVLTVFSAPISPGDQAQLTRLIAGKSTS